MLESLFNKAAGLQTCNFIKKRLQHRCFSMNIAKFLRTTILKNNSERLLLCFCFTLFFGFFVLLGHIRFRCVLSIFRRHKSKCKTRLQLVIRDYSFSTYPKLSKKNISYPLTRTCAYQSVSNVSFSENFAYFLNGLHAFL